jgi:hypothetical protein
MERHLPAQILTAAGKHDDGELLGELGGVEFDLPTRTTQPRAGDFSS